MNQQDLITRYADLMYHNCPVITPLFLSVLQEELSLVEQKEHGFLALLLEAMRAGTIQGNAYVAIGEDDMENGCGCAYGHGTGLDSIRSEELAAENYQKLEISTRFHGGLTATPLETIVLPVQQGEIPSTNRWLAFLEEVLVHFLTNKESEVEV